MVISKLLQIVIRVITELLQGYIIGLYYRVILQGYITGLLQSYITGLYITGLLGLYYRIMVRERAYKVSPDNPLMALITLITLITLGSRG